MLISIVAVVVAPVAVVVLVVVAASTCFSQLTNMLEVGVQNNGPRLLMTTTAVLVLFLFL